MKFFCNGYQYVKHVWYINIETIISASMLSKIIYIRRISVKNINTNIIIFYIWRNIDELVVVRYSWNSISISLRSRTTLQDILTQKIWTSYWCDTNVMRIGYPPILLHNRIQPNFGHLLWKRFWHFVTADT